jgi:hypothetical protein
MFNLSRADEAMFIFKREKLKEKKETVVTQPSKRQKVADPANSGKLIRKYLEYHMADGLSLGYQK